MAEAMTKDGGGVDILYSFGTGKYYLGLLVRGEVSQGGNCTS